MAAILRTAAGLGQARIPWRRHAFRPARTAHAALRHFSFRAPVSLTWPKTAKPRTSGDVWRNANENAFMLLGSTSMGGAEPDASAIFPLSLRAGVCGTKPVSIRIMSTRAPGG